MANEITTVITFRAAKGYLDITRAVNLQFTLTAATPNAAGLTQSISTSNTAISIGSVATLGWAYFRNLDAAHFIDIGHSPDAGTTLYPVIRLNAGEPALLRLSPGVVLYAKADTASCVLEKCIVDS